MAKTESTARSTKNTKNAGKIVSNKVVSKKQAVVTTNKTKKVGY